MDERCISQNELAQRWQVSEAILERWRSQRKGSQFLKLGGQVRYRLVDVESYERKRMEIFGTSQNNLKALISAVRTGKVGRWPGVAASGCRRCCSGSSSSPYRALGNSTYTPMTSTGIQQGFSQHADQRVAAVQFIEVQQQGLVDPFSGQALAQRFGQVLRQKAKMLLAGGL